MGKQIHIPEIDVWLPDKLKEDLDILICDMLYSDMDLLIIIDGKEGSGKSYDSRLIGKYVSFMCKTNFGVDNIHFTTENYINFSEKSKKFTVNILDESREALNKKRGMSKSNVTFTNWLSENRDKQQTHIIVLPAIHDLDSYISIWRMKLLIHKLLGHVEDKTSISKYRLLRGYFRVYENNKNLQQVLYNKQRYGNYSYPKYPKYQRKIKYKEVLTKEEFKQYEDKKAKERYKKYNELKKNNSSEMKYKKLIYNLYKNTKMTQQDIGELVGKHRTVVGDIIRELKKNDDVSAI